MVFHAEVPLRTTSRTHWLDITTQVAAALKKCTVRNGICLVSSQHTTAGLTINENADPDVQRDFFWKLNSVFPQDASFAHCEGNSDSHIKASLVGFSVQVPVVKGELKLGTWQSIYFCEFDGPRNRIVTVSVVGE
ncbi:MAG TPA: secondary thiamine-phosphate synthase enzyme YjbQ [Chitinispirillaceae bacterium]|nr:secondary thiamine-phosphate synthase enzyme YjbQ [Chitinispirillaceae bacterium]